MQSKRMKFLTKFCKLANLFWKLRNQKFGQKSRILKRKYVENPKSIDLNIRHCFIVRVSKNVKVAPLLERGHQEKNVCHIMCSSSDVNAKLVLRALRDVLFFLPSSFPSSFLPTFHLLFRTSYLPSFIPFKNQLINQLIHSFIRSFTHLFIYSHSFVYSFIQALNHSSFHFFLPFLCS